MGISGKLGIKAGHRVLLLGAPDGVIELLDPLPDGATVGVRAGRTPANCTVVFAKDATALAATLPALLSATGLLWVAYPKGGKKAGTDLNRDILYQEMLTHGLSGVSIVAVNDVWSALRLRPTAEVGT